MYFNIIMFNSYYKFNIIKAKRIRNNKRDFKQL